jgi:CheY-like chemotaxis protein
MGITGDRQVKPKILVIEDDAAVVQLLKDMLEFEGYEVTVGFDGKEGVSLVHKEHPRLIIMDIAMPEMSGIDAVFILQQEPETRSIPVIFLTGDPKPLPVSLRQPHIARIQKPINFDDLQKTITRLLGQKSS